jgi:hypothetical protein
MSDGAHSGTGSQPALQGSQQSFRTPRAYWLGVFNGVVFTIGVAFVDPATVLPAFVSRLTDSGVAVGLVSAIGTGGWYLPQLLAARYAQPRPYKRPLYLLAVYLRGSGWVIAIPSVYLLARTHPMLALVCFFLGYSMFALGGGLGGIAFLDIVAKTVSPGQLGSFFGNRQFWGAVGGIAVGFLVKRILDSEALSFPSDYSLLMILALVSFMPGWLAFAVIREPPGEPGEAQPFLSFMKAAPRLLHHHRDLRLLVAGRLLTGASAVALPFYIVYCRRVLEMPESVVGTYLSVQMAGSVLAVPLWAQINDRRGPRALLIVIAALSLAIPALALLGAWLPHTHLLSRLIFGAVFFGLLAATAGGFMASINYLLAIAPEPQRPLYIGVLNTSFALTAFLPMLGGMLVRAQLFEVLFAAGALLGAAGLVVTAKLARPSPPVSG